MWDDSWVLKKNVLAKVHEHNAAMLKRKPHLMRHTGTLSLMGKKTASKSKGEKKAGFNYEAAAYATGAAALAGVAATIAFRQCRKTKAANEEGFLRA